jgi:hypothetical protein
MSTNPAAFAITPDVTVADLLLNYPRLDEPLACLVPAYRALAAASLQQTVGRTLTLHQLAANGGVSLGKLITDLRAAAGVEDQTQPAAAPDWVTAAARTVTLDARPQLAAGGHPLEAVMQGLSELGGGEVYEMLTPFVPAPLVDMARSRGFDAFSIWQGETAHTYFRKSTVQS